MASICTSPDMREVEHRFVSEGHSQIRLCLSQFMPFTHFSIQFPIFPPNVCIPCMLETAICICDTCCKYFLPACPSFDPASALSALPALPQGAASPLLVGTAFRITARKPLPRPRYTETHPHFLLVLIWFYFSHSDFWCESFCIWDIRYGSNFLSF